MISGVKTKILSGLLVAVVYGVGLGRGEEEMDILGQPKKQEWQKAFGRERRARPGRCRISWELFTAGVEIM